MDIEGRLTELLRITDQLAIEVRFVSLGGASGGFCSVKGKKLIVVDSDADVASRYQTILTALAGQQGLDDIFVLPQLRQELDRARQPDE